LRLPAGRSPRSTLGTIQARAHGVWSKRIDIGIAIDTEGGLIVPIMRNVAERDARDLRAGLDRLRADAAARAIPPEELRGATITLSNFA